jgi:hypothetical protein
VRQIKDFRPFRAGLVIAPYQKLRIWLCSFGSFAAENSSFDTDSQGRGNLNSLRRIFDPASRASGTLNQPKFKSKFSINIGHFHLTINQ